MGSSVNRCGVDWTGRMMNTIVQHVNDKKLTLDDRGMSSCFADAVKICHRYSITAKSWMFYDGKRWVVDSGNILVSEVAKEFAAVFGTYAFNALRNDEEKRKKYIRTAEKYGQHKYRQTLINDASTVYAIRREDLDREPELLNVFNGTLELSKGDKWIGFSEHDSSNLLSKLAPVIYQETAKSELWEKFIAEIMDGDKEKIRYLQRVCGLALTADTSLECLWVLYGASTRNGKSTFCEVMSTMLGDYAAATPPETFSQKKRNSSQASGDIARLDSIRFLTASEFPQNMLLDVALVKTLTGRDKIVARNLYEREFEFKPQFKLFLNTNALPLVSDSTLFQSERVRVIEFPVHFSEDKQDRELKRKLTTPENLSGIMNWCLSGLIDFWENGENPPDSVILSTKRYQDNCDKIAKFMDVATEEAEENIPASALFIVFSEWCKNEGLGAENKTTFFKELRKRGLMSDSGTVGKKTVRNVVRKRRVKSIYG